MTSAKSADNPKMVRTITGLSDGTSIPNKAISAIPTIAEVLDINNPLPGSDDQKWFLSLTIKTLN